MIRPDQWHSADGLVFEPNALKAVTMLDENVVVSAGPGAGKTELLAQRADFLLRTGRCRYPRRILAVSFKTDAARNLRDRVRRRSGAQLAARFDSFTFHAFAKRIIDNFRVALTGYNALDPDYRIDDANPGTRIRGRQITFNDLVPLALQIVGSNPYAIGGIRQTYSHVFLDEFQDCTEQQYQLIKAVFSNTGAMLTAVGDTKQRIMAFAGALEGVLQTFAAEFSAQPLPLYQNFRSAPRLRRMQNRMISQMDPGAVSPDEDLTGDKGVIEVLDFNTEHDEASAVADLIERWLDAGTAPSEIAVLVRQQPHLVAAGLGNELMERGVPFRNEQMNQELTAEPAAALILNFIRVIACERQPDAYAELMRIANRSGSSEDEALRFDSQLKRMIRISRLAIRSPEFKTAELAAWRVLTEEFLQLITQPVLTALSPAYQQGTRLEDLIKQTVEAFGRELSVDADPIKSLRRLSELDAIRFLTIHKCKGLEFERVVVLGIERELFWGDPTAAMSEFFVAISRAKQHLVLTSARYREKPALASNRWDEKRTVHQTFLNFAKPN
ncbi:UvrD-helicase domain-containing protein [Actinomadura bangladeshensis]|uniref:DNA 3'-5' helicase n=1 Tax=Actinomadura bangladeshensis TaxID=453573 RepID=A0A6L9QZX8_9ACTN|nr:ATP-dependent helicase [Actinomadura bangladeshensis]NEA29474.1 ATP-dependent helicase [Actinomadura bangladeshensis]